MSIDVFEIAMKQAGIDYNFDSKVLMKDGYHLYNRGGLNEDARNYLKEVPYLTFLTFGKSVVGISDSKVIDLAKYYLESCKSDLYRVFDAPQITKLNNELESHGKCIAHMAQAFLPDLDFEPTMNSDVETRLYVDDEVLELYGDKRFSNALHYRREGKRIDVIAIAAIVNEQVVAVAGATNDSKTMWQIGIDVLPEFRSQGIASTLTYLLSQEILKRGIVPFYVCAWSNIASKNTARKAGFKDAWVEMTAKDTSEEWIKEIRK